MASEFTLDHAALYPYLLDNSLRDDDLLRALREETAQDEMARMQIAPEQGQLMALLVKLTQAKHIIEIGTFTGYSSICMARALPEDGEIICCDMSESWTAIAKKYWHQAKLEHKIKLHLAPAQETLEDLLQQGREGQFQIVFLDADKSNYDTYYELGLKLLACNGLMIIDNVLWSGRVADPSVNDKDTQALRKLNQKLLGDERIDLSMIPMADGITLARKR